MSTVLNVQMVGLFVSDFEGCTEFYRALGIPLEVDAHGAYHHAEHSFHDPYFHFALFPAETEGRSSSAHVTLVVEDCAAATQLALASGGEIVEPPASVGYSGGGITSTVLDPSGNRVELFERRRE